MNTQKIDLTGRRFGRWTVLEQAEPGKGYTTRWLCECDCGTIRTVDGQLLRSGRSRSCGCLQDERQIQLPNSRMNKSDRLRAIYISIRSACENPKDPKYPKFGERGIKVCQEWVGSFDTFRTWSEENGYDSEAFLLRYDVSQGFSPYNSKWAHSERERQGRKGRYMIPANGETHSLAEWSRITGISPSTIDGRLKSGYTPEEAVSPAKKPKGRKPSIMLTANGETHSLAEWSRITGLNRSSIEERLLRGATPEEAVDPVRKPKGGVNVKRRRKSTNRKTE